MNMTLKIEKIFYCNIIKNNNNPILFGSHI